MSHLPPRGTPLSPRSPHSRPPPAEKPLFYPSELPSPIYNPSPEGLTPDTYRYGIPNFANSSQIFLTIGTWGPKHKYISYLSHTHTHTHNSLPPQPRSPSAGDVQQPPLYAPQQELISENTRLQKENRHLRDENTRLQKQSSQSRERVSQLERNIREMKDKKQSECLM